MKLRGPARPLAERNIVAAKVKQPPGEPEAALDLLLGVRVPHEGVFRSQEIEVTYRVGKRRYVERYPIKITLCAPHARFVSVRCESDKLPPC